MTDIGIRCAFVAAHVHAGKGEREREREREQKEVGFKCVSVRVCAAHVFEKRGTI